MNLLFLLIGYLFGSFPSGYLAGKFIKGIDIRTLGSGSTGATNVLRHIGKRAAIAVFLIDVFKGFLSIFLAKFFLLNDSWQIAIGLSTLIGHIWPIWLNWKGGKAVATGLGIFLGISWQVGLATLGVFILMITFFRIVSLASVSASLALPLIMFISFKNTSISLPFLVISLLAMTLVIWRHRENIIRLIKGQEPKIGQR
ncbi:glycerol-3-phosphate 1-O-acyltransferase PlsY [Prochlorococcus marinus]|uniref:Glycerol-3-phosphate acyltransferase n=1 Tax=Prochlorococcus marinus XMU1408 TaxID=2213228 RepID=A0A318R2V3_PROMR|nr:glycerol-3-phosphate 1-O-acyltransferase PlsY [Prochlorococcus marinus]MBW3042511.1 acyl-phosphate glycerol 3-phosphate acyltransferase [Prochlorococcus marinus str. XMU1408]PYE01447.1 acyl-phosphate glycerol 3-phosphate acyltransferase [Prochlorococcus marinus XMU1408]